MGKKQLIEKYALGEVLSDYPDIPYEDIILGLENNVEQVVDYVNVYLPFADYSYSDVVNIIENAHDAFSAFALELESL